MKIKARLMDGGKSCTTLQIFDDTQWVKISFQLAQDHLVKPPLTEMHQILSMIAREYALSLNSCIMEKHYRKGQAFQMPGSFKQ